MTCKSCPTRIRCFLGIRNCQPTPVVGGIVSGNSSSIGDGRLDVGRVADALKERNFNPNPNLVSMHYMPEKDRRVKTAEFGPRVNGFTPPRPMPPASRPAHRTEVVRETVVHTRTEDNIVSDVATIVLMDSILHSRREPEVAPVYAPTPAPTPVYEAPAPAPSYHYEPPAPSPSSYESPSYDSSSYSSSDSSSYSSID